MHQVTVTDHHYDDGFDRSAANDRLLRGTLIGWTDTNKWADRDGMPPPETMIVIGVDEALQRWQCKKLVEVIRDKPLPNVNTLNEATDKSTWEIGLDNKPKAPWVHSFLVYLLDPATAATYTYVNSTYGAKLAYDILRERGHHHAFAAWCPRRAVGQARRTAVPNELRSTQAAGVHHRQLADDRRGSDRRQRAADAAPGKTGHGIKGGNDRADEYGERARCIAGSHPADRCGRNPRRNPLVMNIPNTKMREAVAPPA
jgi:hypothetical protein